MTRGIEERFFSDLFEKGERGKLVNKAFFEFEFEEREGKGGKKEMKGKEGCGENGKTRRHEREGLGREGNGENWRNRASERRNGNVGMWE